MKKNTFINSIDLISITQLLCYQLLGKPWIELCELFILLNCAKCLIGEWNTVLDLWWNQRGSAMYFDYFWPKKESIKTWGWETSEGGG